MRANLFRWIRNDVLKWSLFPVSSSIAEITTKLRRQDEYLSYLKEDVYYAKAGTYTLETPDFYVILEPENPDSTFPTGGSILATYSGYLPFTGDPTLFEPLYKVYLHDFILKYSTRPDLDQMKLAQLDMSLTLKDNKIEVRIDNPKAEGTPLTRHEKRYGHLTLLRRLVLTMWAGFYALHFPEIIRSLTNKAQKVNENIQPNIYPYHAPRFNEFINAVKERLVFNTVLV